MDTKEKLKSLLENYKQNLKDYEQVVSEYEKSDFVRENEYLKKELESHKEQLKKFQEEYEQTKRNNAELKTMLHEQMLSEKMDLLNASKEKLRIYFKNAQNELDDRLTALENKTIEKLNESRQMIANFDASKKQEFSYKIEGLNEEIRKEIQEKSNEVRNSFSKLDENYQASIIGMSSEGLDEEALNRKIRNNNIEMKIGLNFVNKVGIILILLSVATGLMYVHKNWLDNYGKGVFAFLIGLIFLGIGEYVYRKNKKIFATGMLGGGIAILYYSIYYSYFSLKIVDLMMALVLSLIVTALTTVLSLRYDSRTICGLALVGGYFPFVSYISQFSLDQIGINISMMYLLILNATIIIISIYKRWPQVKYISFLLNIPCLMYLVMNTNDLMITLLYSIVTFSIYAFITLNYAIKNRVSFISYDIILLALNTFLSSIIIYNLFEKFNITSFRGVLAIIFCALYIFLAELVGKTIKEDNQVKWLFYLTALTFAILVIPFQFGMAWVSLGWTLEAIAIIIYGLKAKLPIYEKAGWIILGICSGYFIVYELIGAMSGLRINLFELKYTVYTLSIIVVTAVYIKAGELINRFSTRGQLLTYFKNFMLINTWIYSLYITIRGYNLYVRDLILEFDYNGLFLTLIFIVVTILVCKIYELFDRNREDMFIVAFNCTMYIITSILLLLTISINHVLPNSIFDNSSAISYFVLALMFATSLITFLVLKDVVFFIIRKNNFNFELYPLIINIYLLYIIMQFITYQLGFGDISFVVSLIFLIAAFAYIIIGFKKNYIYLRRLGLGLSLFAVAKLAFYDLAFLTTGLKIVAYFVFGIITILISLFYQNLKTKLEGIDKIEK